MIDELVVNKFGKNKLTVDKLVELDVLENILKQFSEATGFCHVAVDHNGVPMTRRYNFSEFCNEVRKTQEGRDLCRECDSLGGLKASQSGKPYIYRCHAGLVDFAVPIMVMEKYVGAILSGQVYVSDEKLIKIDKITDKNCGINRNERLLELRETNIKTTVEKVEATANLLFDISNHIAEKQYTAFIKEELNNKSMKLMEEVNLRLELEKTLKDTELRALQAQINPHFLFNVLNTIGRLALIEGARDTEDMVYSFSELMRYTLKKNIKLLVEFKEEINHLENYLNIQKTRLRERLQYKIDIDRGIDNIMCPFMTLQPIVENSINHVIEKNVDGGKIRITAKKIDDYVEIVVKDNGSGMTQDKIDNILNGKLAQTEKKTGIGVYNVHQRLIHNFGEEYGMNIVSANVKGKGTKTIIKIPITGENYV